MPRVRILGVEKSQGDFTPQGSNQSIHYDNINLYVEDLTSNIEVGHICKKYKVKSDLYTQLLAGNQLTAGQIVDILFNEYRGIDEIRIVK